MFNVVLSPRSALSVMRLKYFTVQIGNLFMFRLIFLKVKGCALYKWWQSSVLGELPQFYLNFCFVYK